MEETTNNKKNKITIISVIVAFISPLILSWYVYNYTDFLQIRGTSNHGDLIVPIRPIDNLSLIDPLQADRKETLHGKWSMIYVASTCGDVCMENVYRMRQIHSAMDKHSLRVQKVLLLTNQKAQDLSEQLTNFAGQQVINTALIDAGALLNVFKLEKETDPLIQHRIYIVDPLGNLMMKFEPEANPRDIMSDLKKLLRASRIG